MSAGRGVQRNVSANERYRTHLPADPRFVWPILFRSCCQGCLLQLSVLRQAARCFLISKGSLENEARLDPVESLAPQQLHCYSLGFLPVFSNHVSSASLQLCFQLRLP